MDETPLSVQEFKTQLAEIKRKLSQIFIPPEEE